MMGQPNMLILDERLFHRYAYRVEDSRSLPTSDGRTHELYRGAPLVDHSYRGCDSCLKDGHVIEKGNHASLMEQRGFYYNLYQSQWQQ